MGKFFILWLVALPLFSVAQDKDSSADELIHWAENQRLSWHDYKGRVDRGSGAAASTATFLGIDYNFSPQGLTYKITCSFSKNKSWGLHRTDYILSHEQAHFDIAEIFARKLNQRMGAYRFDRNNYKKDLRKIYEDIISEKEAMQNRYDLETNHSINKAKQAEWLMKVSELLVELDEFKQYQ